jgi:hypothetical protein
MNYIEDCCWWIKAKLTSEEQVENERELARFEKKTKPELLKGTVMDWNCATSSTDPKGSATAAASAVLSSALTSFSKLTGTSTAALQPQPALIKVLLRLSITEKNGEATGAAPEPAVLTKITDFVMQNDNSTGLVWTSLELEKNKPKHCGRVPLHRIQQVKDKDGCLILLDHENVVLFEGKAPSSLEAKAWVEMIKECLRVLAPRIEDEAAAVRGVTYRSKQLERLETRKKEREEMKKKLGDVTMSYTAKAMMAQSSS